MKALRPHQTLALSMLRSSLAGGRRRPMLQAPTGFGKTLLSAAITDGARRKGKRVLFVVPALSLINQTVEAFAAEGILEVGVIQGNHELTDWSMPVQVASVQTLERRRMPECDIAIVDEAHRWFKFYERWFAEAQYPIIGLSATPWAKGLGKHYDDLLIAATTQELIDAGYLSRFKVYAPSHPDLSDVRTVAGDYHEGDLGKAMDKIPLVADIVSTWKRLGENRSTLCFAVNRAHARNLQAQFEGAGIPTAYVDAYTTVEEREAIAEQFHEGEVRIICNVGTLTTGIDYDVRCIILARPTKSEMLYTQIIGRGLRTAEGKDDCLLRGTRILTDKGEVNIEDVTLDHKVWDGVNFVAHAGAICKGVQPVITHDGITATPDHRVMTNEGWKPLAEAHRRGLRIARTGLGGQPLRLTDDSVAEDGRGELQPSRRGEVRPLREHAYGSLSQHQEASGHERLSSLQWAQAGNGAALAVPAVSGAAGSVLQSVIEFVRAVRRSWDRVSLCWSERGRDLDRGKPWTCGQVDGDRSHQQRRALRAGESALGAPGQEYREQPQVSWWSRAVHSLSELVSERALCRPDLNAVDSVGTDGRGDHHAVEHPFMQAEGEVWDILNAGPLQRFTANGRLVHNCIILDHSDTTLRLGFVTDIHHEHLDNGTQRNSSDKREKKEALPKECPSCSYLKPAKVHACPACGFKPERQSTIECEDGELVEIGVRGRKPTPSEKRSFYAQLRGYAQAHGKTDKWVLANYRSRFNEWPHRRIVPHEVPGPEVLSWLKSQQIRWAHRREAGNAAAAA